MTSRTGMLMCSSREGVCGNNTVWFQSCDRSSYCTALGGNGCSDNVSCQLRDSCSYQISTCSEAISSRIVVGLGFTMLLTSQVISIAFYSEREKSAKFCSEALILA